MYLIPNELNRYSIGTHTKGLRYNADRSLDIYMGQSPPKGKASNWLPAPSGEFNVIMRLFAPKPEMLEDLNVPPIQQIE
jgi:hypothetical protein